MVIVFVKLLHKDEIKETEIKFSRDVPDVTSLSTCLRHVENNLEKKRFYYLRASSYSCLDGAITSFQMNDKKLDDNLFIKIVKITKMLWDDDYADESKLLVNWVNTLLLSMSDEETFSSFTKLDSHVKLSSLLFQMGEWAAARQFLERIIFNLCVERKTPHFRETISSLSVSHLCQESCSLMFVSSFATLDSNARTYDYAADDNEDWTLEIKYEDDGFDWHHETINDSDIKEQGISALNICLLLSEKNKWEEMRVESNDDVDGDSIVEVNDWISLINARYGSHPALWLATSELGYVTKKWGFMNVIRYTVLLIDSTCDAMGSCSKRTVNSFEIEDDKRKAINESSQDLIPSSTDHMYRFLSMLHVTLATCNKEKINIHDTDVYCRQSVSPGSEALFQLSDMPQNSYSNLKRYSNSRNKKVMKRTGLRMFQNDMIEVHIRLHFFWNDYGAFATSQNHFLARIARIQCLSKTLRGDISKSEKKDLCSPEQMKLIKSEVGDVGCLYQQNIMSTPAVFGTNAEFLTFRNDQLKYLTALQNMIFPLIDTSYEDLLEREFNGSYSNPSTAQFEQDNSEERPRYIEYSGEVLAMLRERYLLMADERKIFETPRTLSIGYTYELQEIIKALAPSSAVVPSSATLLERGSAMQTMCEHSGIVTEYMPTLAPSKQQILVDENDDDGKIRVGFLSRFFYDHPVGQSIHSVIENINSSLFDVHVICICCDGRQPSASDTGNMDFVQRSLKNAKQLLWKWLGSENSTPVRIQAECNRQLATDPALFQREAKSVSELNLDVLIYPELGLDRQTLAFASQRLAKVQAVLLSHPVSQRMHTMDYFISSELFHVHNPKCQFPRLYQEKCPFYFTSTEQLILFDGIPIQVMPGNAVLRIIEEDYYDCDKRDGNKSFFCISPYKHIFDSLALPIGTIDMMDRHVYLLPNPVKAFSIVFIRAVASILLKDPIGFVVVLYNRGERFWFEKLRRSIHYHIKKLDCHTNKVDRNLAVIQKFPEMSTHVTQGDCIAAPSRKICKLCCECSDTTFIHSAARRLVLLPRPSTFDGNDSSSFESYVYHSSVVLDSFPAGLDMNSAVDILALGTPIITLPSFQSTPSIAYGLFRSLDLNSTIFVAESIPEYVNMAVKIVQRSSERDKLLKKMRENVKHFIRDTNMHARVIVEWQEMLTKMATKKVTF